MRRHFRERGRRGAPPLVAVDFPPQNPVRPAPSCQRPPVSQQSRQAGMPWAFAGICSYFWEGASPAPAMLLSLALVPIAGIHTSRPSVRRMNASTIRLVSFGVTWLMQAYFLRPLRWVGQCDLDCCQTLLLLLLPCAVPAGGNEARGTAVLHRTSKMAASEYSGAWAVTPAPAA